MSEDACIGWFGEAIGLPFPDSDQAAIALDLRTQLEQIRALDGLEIDAESLSLCFDVRWNS